MVLLLCSSCIIFYAVLRWPLPHAVDVPRCKKKKSTRVVRGCGVIRAEPDFTPTTHLAALHAYCTPLRA